MAAADTGDVIEPQNEPPTAADGWQSGTCYENQVEEAPETPIPTKPTDVSKPFCSPTTPEIFYTQAGGHPPFGFDQYIVRHQTVVPGVVEPLIEDDDADGLPFEDRTLKTERVDLPPGFTENPQGSPQCSQGDFEKVVIIGGQPRRIPACDPSTIVGREEVWLVVNTANAVPNPLEPGKFLPKGFVVSPDPAKGTRVAVYNLEPNEGEPARLGFIIAFSKVIELKGDVAWENDFHEYFTIALPAPSVPFSTLKSRLVAFGQSGDGTHITTPTTCFDPNEWPHLYSTWFRGESYGEPNPTFPEGSTAFEGKLPPGVAPSGCDRVPFDPGLDVDPGTNAVDSPADATVTTTLPFDPAKEGGKVRNEGKEGISQSHVRKAEVVLPKGMGINPSGAQGLVACTDDQFKKGQRVFDNECPAASDIGSVEVVSPPLREPLVGDVYVGTQNSRDPESGDQFRILLEAKSEHEDINARLVGRIVANKTTGDLTAVLNDKLVGQFAGDLPEGLPQVPFESIKVHIDGAKNVLTSPPVCSASGTSRFEPWARPGELKPVTSSVTLSDDPTGGACPKTLAERKFSPFYKAKVNSSKAGAYSPFHVNIARRNGEQELKVVDVTLPKGLTGKLAGIPYCPEEAIAAANGRSGKEEQASPSCSSASQVGTVTTKSGSGNNPLQLGGKAYLAGPYKGAALSLVTITPAVAGPFDLGNVVVRVALNLNPETAQIHAVSDVIPDVFGGVKLDLRAIDLDIDRSQFMLNPTNCYYQETTGNIDGGGADPTDPAAFSSYPVYDPFQAVGCDSLGFKPNLKVQLYGPTKRAKNPRLKATLTARNGDANIGRTALRLPKALFLEQSHIGTVCTRPQLASHTCPKASVYGKAWAQSPLLDKKLQGKVYLVSSDNELPDLLVDLRGQVEIYLRGVISGKGGGLKTVFHEIPDVPVSKFVLNMRGGKKSLLVNSENICKKKQRAFLNMRGWNNKKVKTKKFKLNIVSCGKKGKK
ncbi:MAG TPA: hypothetical protein VKB23_09830 [Solirubrobacterales bacterium]|nr:hypothetical protein [Solirubrobacterales bacterium]